MNSINQPSTNQARSSCLNALLAAIKVQRQSCSHMLKQGQQHGPMLHANDSSTHQETTTFKQLAQSELHWRLQGRSQSALGASAAIEAQLCTTAWDQCFKVRSKPFDQQFQSSQATSLKYEAQATRQWTPTMPFKFSRKHSQVLNNV